jgi:hypothetical protein
MRVAGIIVFLEAQAGNRGVQGLDGIKPSASVISMAILWLDWPIRIISARVMGE